LFHNGKLIGKLKDKLCVKKFLTLNSKFSHGKLDVNDNLGCGVIILFAFDKRLSKKVVWQMLEEYKTCSWKLITLYKTMIFYPPSKNKNIDAKIL